jgi:type II secretory pathway pseudopilin PulG
MAMVARSCGGKVAQNDQSPSRQRIAATAGAGFTLVEAIVIVALLALLVMLLLPTLSQGRESARRSLCRANLRQIGMCTASYSVDSRAAVMIAEPRFWIYQSPYQDPWPNYQGPVTPNYYDRYWVSYLYDLGYYRDVNVINCPSDLLGRNPPLEAWSSARVLGNWIYDMATASNSSYGLNYLGFGKRYLPTHPTDMTTPVSGRFWKTHQVKRPARTFYLADNNDTLGGGWSGFGLMGDHADDSVYITTRHGPVINLYWMDGHVEDQPYREVQTHHYYAAMYLGGTAPPGDPWFNPAQ